MTDAVACALGISKRKLRSAIFIEHRCETSKAHYSDEKRHTCQVTLAMLVAM